MSRMRQVPALDVTQTKTYSINTNTPTSCQRRQNNPTPKFRLSEAPNMISNGCTSLREFCNSIQSITIDLNHLLNSVENLLPLLTTYLATVQNKSNNQPLPLVEQEKAAPVPQVTQAPNVPSPEDMQQLLDNPLIKNILNSFIQNNQK